MCFVSNVFGRYHKVVVPFFMVAERTWMLALWFAAMW